MRRLSFSWTFRLLQTLTGSLGYRILRGEGGLLVIHLSLIISTPNPPTQKAFQTLVALLLLALLYAYNDLYDCERDVYNPKKKPLFVQLLRNHQRELHRTLHGSSAVLIVIAYWKLGWASVLAMTMVLLLNFLYSRSLKKMKGMDVIAVGLWGACYVISSGSPLGPEGFMALALMTGISHFFQTLEDQTPDQFCGIQTTAMFNRTGRITLLLLGCGSLATLFLLRSQWTAAAMAMIPLGAQCLLPSHRVAWWISKASFAMIWFVFLLRS